MKLTMIEKKKDKWRLEASGASHTLLNLLVEKAWDSKALQASYMIKHPYLSKPEIIIRANDPKRVLVDASQLIINDSRDFARELKRVSKKRSR